MPAELRMKARDYCRASHDLPRKQGYKELWGTLSPGILKEVVSVLSQQTLACVPYLKGEAELRALTLQRDMLVQQKELEQLTAMLQVASGADRGI